MQRKTPGLALRRLGPVVRGEKQSQSSCQLTTWTTWTKMGIMSMLYGPREDPSLHLGR